MAERITDLSKPKLSGKARLRYDDVRQIDVLLLPERVVTLNRSAAAILSLCNGQRTASEIARELEGRYLCPGLISDVLEFLHSAYDQRWVV
jgi:pyrroloquinoline quinone biosynthesis protein D